MKPIVSIITINYNQPEQTLEFLDWIKNNSYRDSEVIVVDNASNKSPDFIGKLYPEVKLIKSERNLGFAGGNNLGADAAMGDYLFFVNNDVFIHDGAIENLVKRLYDNPEIGIVSPKIKFYDNPEIIQYAGFNKINNITGRNSAIGSMMKDNGQFDEPMETHYAHGAAMMIKREAFEKAGPMPEMFFLYYEELDWSNQIKKAGYKVFYEPKSVVLHKQSVSAGKNSPLKIFYMTRNRILFMHRNVSVAQFLLFLCHFMFLAAPKNVSSFILNGEKSQLRAYFKALMALAIPSKNKKLNLNF